MVAYKQAGISVHGAKQRRTFPTPDCRFSAVSKTHPRPIQESVLTDTWAESEAGSFSGARAVLRAVLDMAGRIFRFRPSMPPRGSAHVPCREWMRA